MPILEWRDEAVTYGLFYLLMISSASCFDALWWSMEDWDVLKPFILVRAAMAWVALEPGWLDMFQLVAVRDALPDA